MLLLSLFFVDVWPQHLAWLLSFSSLYFKFSICFVAEVVTFAAVAAIYLEIALTVEAVVSILVVIVVVALLLMSEFSEK
jgi:hypothetical protein